MERWKDEPFAIVGVNTDGRDAYAKGMATEPVPWRSFDDGTPDGPICTTWNVSAFPTLFVLDHEGVIRHRNLWDADMEEAVAALLAGAKAAATSK